MLDVTWLIIIKMTLLVHLISAFFLNVNELWFVQGIWRTMYSGLKKRQTIIAVISIKWSVLLKAKATHTHKNKNKHVLSSTLPTLYGMLSTIVFF